VQASFIVIVVDVLVEVVVTRLLLERLVVHVGMQCLRTANANGQTGQVFWGAQKGVRRAPGVSPAGKGVGRCTLPSKYFTKGGKGVGTDYLTYNPMCIVGNTG